MSSEGNRCGAETKDGKSCRMKVKEEGLRCYKHKEDRLLSENRCKADTIKGNRCLNQAVKGDKHCRNHIVKSDEEKGNIFRCGADTTKTDQQCRKVVRNEGDHCRHHGGEIKPRSKPKSKKGGASEKELKDAHEKISILEHDKVNLTRDIVQLLRLVVDYSGYGDAVDMYGLEDFDAIVEHCNVINNEHHDENMEDDGNDEESIVGGNDGNSDNDDGDNDN
uniref:Uncharacterized protein n=1 Tax=Pithovirus LCPAC404 TaxID=2506597 RepID=A0A481ZEP2_9VIRU|nr:MAG: hypothetical protein LCPAC404_02640 [Pithovirus LCPAC404]